jgi:outer membrane translocation and assembly module TamA
MQSMVQGFRALALLVPLALCGCYTVPEGRAAIYGLNVRAVDAKTPDIDTSDLEELLATTPSPKFLSLFRGIVYDYTLLERGTLQRDLARVEAYCRARGYYEARARAGRIHYPTRNHVRVEILVEVGEPILTAVPTILGVHDLPRRELKAVTRAVSSKLVVGDPFDQERFDESKADLLRALTARGYAYADVKSEALIDVVAHKASVVFTVTTGPSMRFGAIEIQGLGDLSPSPVRAVMRFAEGDRYDGDAIETARQAILDLGVFAAVDIVPKLDEANDDLVPIQVTVEPSRLRNVRVGAGIEFDVLRADVHGLFGWEHRNFFGHLRVFSVDTRPGLVFYPLRVNNLTAPTQLLPENRLRIEVRERGLFNTRATGFVRPQVDIYPVLIDPNPKNDAPVLGYGEARLGVGADATFWRLYVALSHNIQGAFPFSYRGPLDDTLTVIALSYPELLVQLDLRDNRIHPKKGVLMGVGLQTAGGPFLGDADDVKVSPEIRGYMPLGKHVVFAARAGLGLLFPRNYGQAVSGNAAALSPRDRTRDYQITFFRGLFSGGPNSNRGYPPRGISPYGNVGFLTPEGERLRRNEDCAVDCRVPTGGFSQWEASAELRFPIVLPFSGAVFCDAADVSPKVAVLRFSHLHLSCGLGARYDTPVGPVRVDVGYRIPGLQVQGGLSPDERAPQNLFGVPIALAVGIGEAF